MTECMFVYRASLDGVGYPNLVRQKVLDYKGDRYVLDSPEILIGRKMYHPSMVLTGYVGEVSDGELCTVNKDKALLFLRKRLRERIEDLQGQIKMILGGVREVEELISTSST